jgi:hypothetical protein
MEEIMKIKQSHCGFYVYRDAPYINREEILGQMLINDDLDGDFQFIFNDDVFSKLDWTIEPPFDLKTLYRERAQQLRDQYKYLILSYSGGSDSQEVLGTFIENGIFLDEVQIVTHEKAISRLSTDLLMSDDSLKMLLEYRYAAVPQLRKLAEVSPNTKITEIDISDDLVGDVLGNKFSFFGMQKSAINASFVTQNAPHSRNFFQQHHNNRTLKHQDGACFIRGIEKPSLRLRDGTLHFMFTDVSMHTVRMIQLGHIDEVYTIENFFWSRECPLIPIKQSHVIKRSLESDVRFLDRFLDNQKKSSEHVRNNLSGMPPEQNFKREYNRYIYHHWNEGMFLAPKTSHGSPDLKLIDALQKENSIRDAIYEQHAYFYNRYKQIRNKTIFNKSKISRSYLVGNLEPNADK